MPDTDAYPPPVMVPIGEVARLLNVGVRTVRAWEAKGKLTAIRTPGGQRRFRVTDVEALMQPQDVA